MATEVRVGINQLNNPTPPKLKTAFRIVSFVNGVVAIVTTAIPQIPTPIKYTIVTSFSLANTLMHFAIKFFGLVDTGVDN